MDSEKDKKDIKHEDFGRRFSEALTYLKISQKEMQEEIGKNSVVNFSHYANGKSIPKGDIALLLLQKFPEVNWYYVFFGVGKLSDPLPIKISKLEEKFRLLEMEHKNLLEKYELLQENANLLRQKS